MSRTGIGASYVQRQLNQGRSLASIQREAQRNGWEIGAKAASMFNSAPAPAPAPSYSPPPAPAPRTGIGASYVQQQLNQGRSLSSIQAEAQRNGWEIGEKAQTMFRNASNASSGSNLNQFGQPATGRFFDPSNYSGAEDSMGNGGFGLEALNRARKAGYSDAQIRTTLAGAGMEIGPKAANALGVMAGKTFYTGADGTDRPDHVPNTYLGQAGNRDSRPVLLKAGSYNSAMNKPFDSNVIWVSGGANDADAANLYVGEGQRSEPGSYGVYKDDDWHTYIGENGYLSALPDVDENGNALRDPNWTPGQASRDADYEPEQQYQDTRSSAVSAMNSALAGAPSQGMIASSSDSSASPSVTVEADLGSEVTGQSDVPVIQTKVNAINNDVSLKNESNVGKLTGGSLRKYYGSRFN